MQQTQETCPQSMLHLFFPMGVVGLASVGAIAEKVFLPEQKCRIVALFILTHTAGNSAYCGLIRKEPVFTNDKEQKAYRNSRLWLDLVPGLTLYSLIFPIIAGVSFYSEGDWILPRVKARQIVPVYVAGTLAKLAMQALLYRKSSEKPVSFMSDSSERVLISLRCGIVFDVVFSLSILITGLWLNIIKKPL